MPMIFFKLDWYICKETLFCLLWVMLHQQQQKKINKSFFVKEKSCQIKTYFKSCFHIWRVFFLEKLLTLYVRIHNNIQRQHHNPHPCLNQQPHESFLIILIILCMWKSVKNIVHLVVVWPRRSRRNHHTWI